MKSNKNGITFSRKVGQEPTIRDGLRSCSRCSDKTDVSTWKPVDKFYPPTTGKNGKVSYRYYCIACETERKRSKGVGTRLYRPESHATKVKVCESCEKTKALKHYRLIPPGGTKNICFKCERARIKCELCEEEKHISEFDKSNTNKPTGRQRVCRQCNNS